MSDATVSVALCTHNGAAFVGEQLASILAQTFAPLEVVVSDDASTDATLEIVQETWDRLVGGRTGPRLRVLRNETPLGVVRNFEQAASATTGELIALSDQDDVWAPDRLALMVGRFAQRPELELLFTDARLVDSKGQPLGSLFDALEIGDTDLAALRTGDAFAVLLRRNLITGATVMLRRQLLERARPFPASWIHDEWLAIIGAATAAIDWMPDQLVDYRQHGANQIGVAAPSLRYKVRRVLEPRGDRYTTLVARTEELVLRLRALQVDPRLVEQAESKLAHERFRSVLPSNRLARVIPVARVASTGAYERYSSRGRLDILRDLLQPDRSAPARRS
jgi:glycosyltransferase involved in cell wall biosynthesis